MAFPPCAFTSSRPAMLVPKTPSLGSAERIVLLSLKTFVWQSSISRRWTKSSALYCQTALPSPSAIAKIIHTVLRLGFQVSSAQMFDPLLFDRQVPAALCVFPRKSPEKHSKSLRFLLPNHKAHVIPRTSERRHDVIDRRSYEYV